MNNTLAYVRTLRVAGRYEKIIVFAFSLLLFTDPRILFRIILGNDLFAVIAATALLLALSLLTIRMININQGLNKPHLILFILFFFYAFIKYLSGGVALANSIQYFPLVIYGCFIYCMTRFNDTVFIILKGLLFAMCLHVISLLPIGFIRQGLAEQTSYGLEAFNELVGARRETGFTSSAGFLSLYSSVAFGIGITMFYYQKKKEWLVLFIAALACGIATFNRSFLLAVAVYFLLCPLFLKGLKNYLFSFLLIICFLFSSYYVLERYTNYTKVLAERFTVESLFDPQNDRLYGETGIVDLVHAVAYSPFVGSLQRNPKGEFGTAVFNGRIFLRPHNGPLGVLASYGILFGGIYIFLVLNAVVKLIRRNRKNNAAPLEKAMLAAIVLMNVVCLVEPLYELPIVLLCVFYGCNLQSVSKHPKISIQQ